MTDPRITAIINSYQDAIRSVITQKKFDGDMDDYYPVYVGDELRTMVYNLTKDMLQQCQTIFEGEFTCKENQIGILAKLKRLLS